MVPGKEDFGNLESSKIGGTGVVRMIQKAVLGA